MSKNMETFCKLLVDYRYNMLSYYIAVNRLKLTCIVLFFSILIIEPS